MTVFVFGVPKTGNSTILRTFQQVLAFPDLLSGHFITDREILRNLRMYEAHPEAMNASVGVAFGGILQVQAVLKAKGFFEGFRLLRSSEDSKLLIVTSFRDPVDLVYSSIFYHFRNESPERILSELDKAFTLHLDYWVACQDRWITEELSEFSGINLFSEPFDAGRGFTVLTRGDVTLLALRTDRITPCLVSAVREASGMELPSVCDDNTADSNNYADLYREVRSTYVPPVGAVERIRQARVMGHFFPEGSSAGSVSIKA